MTNEEAREVLQEQIDKYGQEYDEKGIDALNTAIKLLEQTRWVPVSERLPEDHKDVLICLSSGQICVGCYNSHRLPFSNNVIGWGASYAHNWCSDEIVAWMPLPQPYKAESEEENE